MKKLYLVVISLLFASAPIYAKNQAGEILCKDQSANNALTSFPAIGNSWPLSR